MSGWKMGDPGFVAAMKTADRALAEVKRLAPFENLYAETLAACERAEEDNARLRALIKDAEWGDGTQGGRWCPWCQSKEERGHYAKTPDCATDCPAFTPEGTVK